MGWSDNAKRRKKEDGLTVPSAQLADLVSCWCISLVLGLPCSSLYFCLFIKVSSNSERPCRSACFKVDINVQGLQVPLTDMYLYSIIGTCQWGSFLPVVYHISLNYGIPFFFTSRIIIMILTAC